MIPLILATVLNVPALPGTLSEQCLDTLQQIQPASVALRSGKADEKAVLGGQNRCAWSAWSESLSPAVLLSIPASTKSLAVEIAAELDADEATTVNVAQLSADGNVIAVAPFTSFRERQDAMRLRFVLPASATPSRLLITGAGEAPETLFRRIYRSASSKTLSVIGLETGADAIAEVQSRPTGDIRLRIEPYARTLQ